MTPVESQFHVPPFPPFPSAERYVRLESQDDALQRVCRAVDAWEAISLVIGPPGTGKSLLCRMVKNHFAGKREVIVFGDAMLENPASLQRHLLSRLDRIRGIASSSSSVGAHSDPQLAIIERIANSSNEFAGLLLLVDEAQDLSAETLETIRILTNTMTNDGRPRVSAVLAGGPKLDETLALPALEALVQRVATRCYMHPISSDETVHYVREVLKQCGGWAEEQIDEAAIRSVHRACSGVPRLINQLMTASIQYAQSKGIKQLTGQTVDQAWAILQQLPSPIVDEPELARPTSEIEFGPLRDDGEEALSFASETVNGENELSAPVWDEAPSLDDSADSIFNRVAEHCNDDFDMLEIEPCDTPKAKMEFSLDDTVDATIEFECDETETSLGLISDEVKQEPAPSLESLSMDCQTIGNFESVNSDYAEFQIDSMQCGSASQDVCCETEASSDDLFGDFDEEEPVENSPSSISVNAQDTSDTDGNNAPVEDLETSLHREILSLRGAASAPVLWMADGEAEDTVDDDRDLLVIEDDVQVDGVGVSNEVETVEPGAKEVAVDFQAMLAKMRAPSR